MTVEFPDDHAASSGAVPPTAPAADARPRRSWFRPNVGRGWKARLRWTGLRLIAYYAVIVFTFAAFQRSLIYYPQRFTNGTPPASGLPSGQVREITFPTEDGLELHGWHVLPAGHNCSSAAECLAELRQAKRVLVHFHGNGGSRLNRAGDCRTLAQHDAHVLIIDYRGYGENPGSPSETGLARDARAIWRYATEGVGVPRDRIVLYGESLGGGVAVRLASDLSAAKTPPAGLILVSTFTSLVDVAASHYPWLPVRLVMLDRYPSIDRAPLLTCSVLQIHGTHDTLVAMRLGRQLFQAIPEESVSGVPKQFVELPGAGHNDISESMFGPHVQAFLDAVGKSD